MDPGEEKHTQVWRSWEGTSRSKVRVNAHFELGNSPEVWQERMNITYSMHPLTFFNLRPNSWPKSRQKFFQSFPPCYSPLQLSVSTNSRNLLHFYIALLYTVKEKVGKPDRKPYPLPDGLEIHKETSSLSTLKFMPRNLKEIVRSWIWLRNRHKSLYLFENSCRWGV